MSEPYLNTFLRNPRNRKLFMRDAICVSVACELNAALKKQKLTPQAFAEAFAKKDGIKLSKIESFLEGQENLTLHEVADMFTALGRELKIKAIPFR